MTRTFQFLLDALVVAIGLFAILCVAFLSGAAFVAATNIVRACS